VTRRGAKERPTDITDVAQDALEFCEGLDEAAFASLASEDRRTYRALKNVSAEIGEVVKGLPADMAARAIRAWIGAAGPGSATWWRTSISALSSRACGPPPWKNHRC
jgi:hypothetical protein